MKIEQIIWSAESGWVHHKELPTAGWVLAFGSREALSESERYTELRAMFPNADIMLATTSGEIANSGVLDNSIVATAVEFEHTPTHAVCLNINTSASSFDAGQHVASLLPSQDLKHIFVISDGSLVNGSELIRGLNSVLPEHVAVTGGLAGDAARFEKTLVGLNAAPTTGNIVAIGLYGNAIKVGFGSVGGWNAFGPERRISKSHDNILYELDGQSALELYKKYLGDQAAGLPSTALLFPLSIKENSESTPVVRTILTIDEQNQAMIFAGNMPEGATAKLMMANFDRLIDGAVTAAEHSLSVGDIENNAELVICISCVGRKLVLGPRIDEEIEGVRDIVGEEAVLSGFYSYGEISPFSPTVKCELHNQTMTITALRETV